MRVKTNGWGSCGVEAPIERGAAFADSTKQSVVMTFNICHHVRILLIDSAEYFLRIFHEILAIQYAEFFRKPDDEWYNLFLLM